MAIRKPLVLNGGHIEQLQAGDRLAPVPNDTQLINGETDLIQAGQPIVIDDTGNAKYTIATNGKGVIAFCVIDVVSAEPGVFQVDGILSLTTEQWDNITGENGGLRPGKIYFLDDSAVSKMTRTAPTATGHYIVRLGTAINKTDFTISIGIPTRL